MNMPNGAHLIPDMHPGDPDWLRVMSASKIAAVVGLSPYESAYSLWQTMAGRVDPQPNNAILERGHYLEPAIAAWFADQHPEYAVRVCGTYAHPTRPEHVASPDRLLLGDDNALLEIKSAFQTWQWGDTGSDEIPIGYRCQVMWQMYVTGVHTCYVAVITGSLDFRWYRIDYDDADAALLVDAADRFMASLHDETEPDVDASEHTYAALRELHPDIDGTTVQIPGDLAAQWVDALNEQKRAKTTRQAVQNRIAHLMGNAQYAEWNGTTYARRQARKGSKPYVTAPAGLTEQENAA